MALGDIKWFAQGLLDLGLKRHDLSTDSLKLGLIKGTTPPAIADALPTFGGTGTVNHATNEVKAGTSYTAGGVALTGVKWVLVTSVPTLQAAKVTFANDATGFTDARYGVIYNATDASKRAIAYIDLGADRSVVAGSLTLDWSGVTDNILTITQS
jgi:hypothetical protein